MRWIKRRRFLVASGALLAAPLALAQPAGRVFKVSMLTTAGARGQTPFYVALEERFRELGYVEGKNFALDWHSATGRLDKIPEIAAELARNRPDVVIATGSEIVLRSIRGTVGTTPIVMVAIDFDPVERNFVASLSSPGGNITGLFLRQLESAAKRLELLAEALPDARRIAVLWDKFSRDQLDFVAGQAKQRNLTLLPFEMSGNSYEFEAPLRSAKSQKAQAVLALTSGAFFPVRQKMFAAAGAQRLPVIANSNYADEGAMIAFGANFPQMYRRAVEYADRILKGAKPAELPVEQPTKYDLIVNLKVARALGLKLPNPILLRADRVIE